jgi:hypothetical protein
LRSNHHAALPRGRKGEGCEVESYQGKGRTTKLNKKKKEEKKKKK